MSRGVPFPVFRITDSAVWRGVQVSGNHAVDSDGDQEMGAIREEFNPLDADDLSDGGCLADPPFSDATSDDDDLNGMFGQGTAHCCCNTQSVHRQSRIGCNLLLRPLSASTQRPWNIETEINLVITPF